MMEQVKLHGEALVRVVLEIPEVPEVLEWIQEGQGKAGEGHFCLEIHQQGFMSVMGCNRDK